MAKKRKSTKKTTKPVDFLPEPDTLPDTIELALSGPDLAVETAGPIPPVDSGSSLKIKLKPLKAKVTMPASPTVDSMLEWPPADWPKTGEVHWTSDGEDSEEVMMEEEKIEKPKKRRKKKKKIADEHLSAEVEGHTDDDASDRSGAESEATAEERSEKAKKKRKRSKKAVQEVQKAKAVDDPADDDESVDAYVWIISPPRKIPTAGRHTKMAESEPSKSGPISLTIGMEFTTFLEAVALCVGTITACLDIKTLTWRFLKAAAKADCLPITNSAGLVSMFKQIGKKSGDATVILRMGPLRIAPANVYDGVPAVRQPDENLFTSDEDVPRKKVKFNDALEDELVRLHAEHYVGRCPLHPTKHCITHHVTGLHFDIDRPKGLVFAAAVLRGETTRDKIPIKSDCFKPHQALKVPKTPQNSADSQALVLHNPQPPPPSQPFPSNTFGVTPYTHHGYPYGPPPPYAEHPNHPQFNPGYPSYPRPQVDPFAGWTHSPWPGPSQSRGAHSSPSHGMRSSSPLAPGDTDMDDYFRVTGLDENVRERLENMSFAVGDDLSKVPKADYEAAGFKYFEWMRIITADRKYRHQVKAARRAGAVNPF